MPNAASSEVPMLAGAGDPNRLVGTYQAKPSPANGTTAVFGKVCDGVTPQTVVQEDPDIDGACTLREAGVAPGPWELRGAT